MRGLRYVSVAFGIAVGAIVTTVTPPPAAFAQSTAAPVIVMLKPNADVPVVTDALQLIAGFSADLRFSSGVKGFSAKLTPGQRSAISLNPAVARIIPDSVLTLEAPVTAATTTGYQIPTGLNRIGALPPTNPKKPTKLAAPSDTAIAVIDTGVARHPDLRVAGRVNCTGERNGSAYSSAHGTEVAGVIAARGQKEGIVGVTPGSKIYSIKIFPDNGPAYLSYQVCALDWVIKYAAKRKIKVVNMSFSRPLTALDGTCATATEPDHTAICRGIDAGITFVAAAGNYGADLDLRAPAAYPEVLTATAMSDSDGAPGGLGAADGNTAPGSCVTDPDDSAATFSNFATTTAAQAHTIAAPGDCILTTAPNKNYTVVSGTSFAAPTVAGVVARCIGSRKVPGPCADLGPTQIVDKLIADANAQPAPYGYSGDPNSPIAGRYYGPLVYAGSY